MIESISLRDVQGHKETYIELDPGVNVFVGFTDAGKSAIVKALDWWGCDGNAISPKNKQNKNVTVVVDGRKISKSRSGNTYIYQIDDGPYLIGKAIPDKVLKICEFASINFQNQFDPPFMVMDTGIERSKVINDLIDLRGMDTCRSEANISAINKQREIAFLIDKIGEEKTRIKKMDDILIMSRYFTVIEKKGVELDNNLIRIDKIQELCKQLSKLAIVSEKYKHISTTESSIEKLLKDIQTVREVDELIENITKCVQGLGDVQKRIGSVTIDINEIGAEVERSLQLCMKYTNNSLKIQSLQSLIDRLDFVKTEKSVLARKLKSMEKQFVLPDVCPLCGQFICEGEC